MHIEAISNLISIDFLNVTSLWFTCYYICHLKNNSVQIEITFFFVEKTSCLVDFALMAQE